MVSYLGKTLFAQKHKFFLIKRLVSKSFLNLLTTLLAAEPTCDCEKND